MLREPYSKYLEDGIFEVRGKVGNDISRVLYHGGKIILTNGFIKKTQKTPRSAHTIIIIIFSPFLQCYEQK